MRTRSKYGNKVVYADPQTGDCYQMTNVQAKARGLIKFDSVREYTRWLELRLLLRAGEISELELQPRFILRESFQIPGERKRAQWTYTGDFRYIENGVVVVEDVKGHATKEFKLRWDEVRYQHLGLIESGDIEFRIVK